MGVRLGADGVARLASLQAWASVDLDGAAEVYPDARWPTQIADALRELIHQANIAREQGQSAITDHIKTS